MLLGKLLQWNCSDAGYVLAAYLDGIGQLILWSCLAYFFVAYFISEILLKIAFNEIGKGHATREQRVGILQRIYRNDLKCEHLQENANFKAVIFLIRSSRISLVILIVSCSIVILSKYLS